MCCVQVLYGVTQTQARWKSCVDSVASEYMPFAAGQLYVKSYFSPTAKTKVFTL